MIVTCVYVSVKEDHIDDFIKATVMNHEESVKEPGNLRFDLIQETNDPGKFMLYEAYDSEEASARHKQTPHYELWRNTVANWMAEPRKGVIYRFIAPSTLENHSKSAFA